MITGTVANVAHKIDDEVMPNHPGVLYNSIITIVSLIDDSVRNLNVTPALKNECATSAMLKNLRYVMEPACLSSWKTCEDAERYIFKILEAYSKIWETP